MSKIYIIGAVGSGKTTLAKRLAKAKNIPYYEIDEIVYYRKNHKRHRRTLEEQLEVINQIDYEGDWILEGIYRKSSEHILVLCDEVIVLYTPRWRRIIRIFIRFIKQKLKIEECNYKSDFKMLKKMWGWSWEFEKKSETLQKALGPHRYKVIVIKSSKQINTYIHRSSYKKKNAN